MPSSTYWQNYRIKIYPSPDQQKRIISIINTFRFCYNWGLSKCNENYVTTNKTTSKFTLAKQFTEYRNQPENKWLLDYDVTTCRFALWNVVEAFTEFFRGNRRYPKYKSKKNAYKQTLQLRGERVKFYDNGRYVQLPGISTKDSRIYCGRHLIPISSDVKYMNVYVTYIGNEFWLSLSVCMRKPIYDVDSEQFRNDPLGIDVGVRRSAVLSDGTVYDSPNRRRSKLLRNRISSLKSAISKDVNRRVVISRRTKTKYEDIPKSNNQLKREARLRKSYRNLVNFYQGYYHQISADIVKKNPLFVVIENLPIRDICKENKFLADELTQARLGTLLRYIEYKCNKNDIPVYKAPRTFPSSQICSSCGNSYKINESKIYRCPKCGCVIDRDLNAALNLLNFGEKVHIMN